MLMLLPPITLPTYTIADLDAFPADGQRYELLQGFLLVTPAPRSRHQFVAARLITALSTWLLHRVRRRSRGRRTRPQCATRA